MINKNKFSIKDTKKVLHKVGKKWVVVSAVLLGLAAGGAAVTTANADTTQAAAQPTAAQQVAKNANNSAANHSLGVAAPTNLGARHVAPATETPDVNTMMQKAANDVKGKAHAKISSVKNRAKNDISTYKQFADVNHLTSFANDVKGTPAQPAYTSLVNLANNLNGSTYSSLALGNTSAPASSTVFSMLNQASAEIPALNVGNISTTDRVALGKIDYEINRIEHDASNTALGAGKTYTIPAGTFNVSMASNSNIPLPNSISASADGSSFNISNIQLPSTFSYHTPAITVSLPSVNVRQLINNGISYGNVTASVANSLNNVATQVSDDVTNDAERAASTFINNNADSISNSLVNSPDVKNFVDAQANKFVMAYKNALNPVTVLSQAINDYKNAYQRASTFKYPANKTVHVPFRPFYIHVTPSQQRENAIRALNSRTANALEHAPLNLNQGQASDFETAALQPRNNTANDALQDIIENKTGLSQQDAKTLLATLNKPGKSSQDAVNSVLGNKLPSLLAPMLTDLEDPTKTSTPSNVNNTASTDLKGIIKNVNINDAVQSKVNGAISPLITNIEDTIDSVVQLIVSPNAGFAGGDIKPLKGYTLSGVNSYLKGVNNNIHGVLNNPFTKSKFNGYTKQLNNVSSHITSLSKHLDNLQNDLNNFFGTQTTSSAYSNLVNNVANLPSDLTATSGKATNTEEQSAYSAYSNIASDIKALSGIAVNEARAKRGNVDAAKVSGFAKLNYGEAKGSAMSMDIETILLNNDIKSVNHAIDNINGHNQSNFSHNGSSLDYSQALARAQQDSTAISNAASAYANSLSSVSVPRVEAEANDANSIQSIASTPGHHTTPSKPAGGGSTTPSNDTGNNSYTPSFVFPSTPTTTNMNYNVVPTNTNTVTPEISKKHAANYAKVVKALQLHTNPNFTKRNAVAVVKPGTTFQIEKAVKAHNGALRYEVKYNKKNYFVTANKRWVSAYYKAAKHATNVMNYGHYRYAKVGKALQLHTSPSFTKRNGVKVVRPGVEFRINRIVKSHGLVRYEVRYQGHNYFITANNHFTANAYLQKSNFRKHGYKAVRAIKPVNEYRHVNFTKRGLVRHFYRGTVLPVRRVLTIGKGEVTRLQLTNGRYVSANKNLVNVIK